MKRIRREGCPLIGYLYWSFFDNYEWGTFTPCFGLFSIDFTRTGSERSPVSAAGSNPSMTYARLIAKDEWRPPEGIAGCAITFRLCVIKPGFQGKTYQ